MSTTLTNNIINSPHNNNKHLLTLQTKSPSFSNMKQKKPKFQASKPSYLLSGIVSKLLLDYDNKVQNNNINQYTKTFSPFQKPAPLNLNNPPIQKILPHKTKHKETNSTTEPNLRLKTISVNTTKSNNPNEKRLKERNSQRKVFSKHKDTLSLSITHPNSSSFTKDKYMIHSDRKLQTSNSFTSGKKLISKISSKVNIEPNSKVNKPQLLTNENYVKTYRPNSKKTLTLKSENNNNNNKSGSNIFSNRVNTNTTNIDLSNGILQSKLLSSPKIQVPPKKISNSPTQIYHPKFSTHNVNIYTPRKTISTKPVISKNLGKTKSMTAIINNNNSNSNYLSKEKNGLKKTISKNKINKHFSKPGSPSIRSNNSSGRNSHTGTTVYIEADKVKQKFKKKVQNEITKRKYSNHKLGVKEEALNEIGISKKDDTNINNTNNNNYYNQIELRVLKIDSCTMAGFSEPNVQKINQDNFFIEKNFFNKPEQFFVGVCDGHGIYGHFCSDYIANNFPSYLNVNYIQHQINSPKQPITPHSLNTLITKSFVSFNNELISQKDIDSSLSGSTCVALVIFQDKLICANLGDSRAVLSRFENGSYSTLVLSRDHKPTEQDECERIITSGGKVSPYYEEETQQYIGPNRIWFKDSGIPGLAMTRSFGDEVAHKVGVISEPELKEVVYNGNEKFIIIASDGIWEFIDCEESVHIVKEFYENDRDAKGAVRALVGEAFRRWRREEDIVDDITALVVFFE